MGRKEEEEEEWELFFRDLIVFKENVAKRPTPKQGFLQKKSTVILY